MTTVNLALVATGALSDKVAAAAVFLILVVAAGAALWLEDRDLVRRSVTTRHPRMRRSGKR